MSETAILMKTSASTVARRIRELEDSCGVVLFNKRQNGYFLTVAGAALLPHAERIASDVSFLERQITSVQSVPQPRVKVELPELVGAYLIVPGMADLVPAESTIQLDIANTAETTRLTKRANDLVLRLKRPEAGDYSVKRIGKLSRGIYASPHYLEARQCGPDISNFSQHRLIGWGDEYSHLGTAQWFRDATQHEPLWMRASNVRVQIDAVVAGLGLGALPKFIADRYKLVEINADEFPSTDAEIWLLRSQVSKDLPHVKSVAAWIEKIVSVNKNVL